MNEKGRMQNDESSRVHGNHLSAESPFCIAVSALRSAGALPPHSETLPSLLIPTDNRQPTSDNEQ